MAPEIGRDDVLGEDVVNKNGKDMTEYTLYHPSGFAVKVRGAGRKEVLLDRGYTTTKGGEARSTKGKTSAARKQVAEGGVDTLAGTLTNPGKDLSTGHDVASSDSLVDGTVDEVLEAVGDDPDLAAQAIEQERAGKNRVTLIEQLEEITTQ